MHIIIPDYIDNECLYSYACRINNFSVFHDLHSTNRTIFNRLRIRFNPVLPNRITALALATKTDPTRLLLESTGYSLVSMPMDSGQKLKLCSAMMGASGSMISSASNLAASRLGMGHHYKYCPTCFEIDDEILGVGLWRTFHQFPWVTMCPIHECLLYSIRNDEGGLNKKLINPYRGLGEPMANSNTPAPLKLSKYIFSLWNYLKHQSPIINFQDQYRNLLSERGFVTPKGHLRCKSLKDALIEYWNCGLSIQHDSYTKMLRFDYLPSLLHNSDSTHYVKHILLMAFLAKKPEDFFNKIMPQQATTSAFTPQIRSHPEPHILADLKGSVSLREISRNHQKSIGYLKQLATRNHLQVKVNPSIIDTQMARTIWRKAFYGIHREIIARDLGISTSSVEAIIQGHNGLSCWRRHLKEAKKKKQARSALLDYREKNQTARRKEIREAVPDYLWLFKRDKDWLNANLPPPMAKLHYNKINWLARDEELFSRLSGAPIEFKSLSEIARYLGNQTWLKKHSEDCPKTIRLAKSILNKN